MNSFLTEQNFLNIDDDNSREIIFNDLINNDAKRNLFCLSDH